MCRKIRCDTLGWKILRTKRALNLKRNGCFGSLQVYNFLMKRQTSCTSAKDNYSPTLTVNVSCFEQIDELQCDALTCSFWKEKKTLKKRSLPSTFIHISGASILWTQLTRANRAAPTRCCCWAFSSCASALDREIKALHSAHCCPVPNCKVL